MGFFDSVYAVKFWFEFLRLLCLVAGIVGLLMFMRFLVVGLEWWLSGWFCLCVALLLGYVG